MTEKNYLVMRLDLSKDHSDKTLVGHSFLALFRYKFTVFFGM